MGKDLKGKELGTVLDIRLQQDVLKQELNLKQFKSI